MDKRTRARELAIQALYQLDVQGDEMLKQIALFFYENERDEQTRQLAYSWASKAWHHRQYCDDMISSSLKKWKLDRLSAVDRSILRLGVYQLKFCSDIPERVVINEAIELAKKFSTEASPAFVNGLLDAISKKQAPI